MNTIVNLPFNNTQLITLPLLSHSCKSARLRFASILTSAYGSTSRRLHEARCGSSGTVEPCTAVRTAVYAMLRCAGCFCRPNTTICTVYVRCTPLPLLLAAAGPGWCLPAACSSLPPASEPVAVDGVRRRPKHGAQPTRGP
jgi:hypothetical protein